MLIFSKETEKELKKEVVDIVCNFLEESKKTKDNPLGIISQSELLGNLDITYRTLMKWEEAGLRRYVPPIKDTRTIFYKTSDVLRFLGVIE